MDLFLIQVFEIDRTVFLQDATRYLDTQLCWNNTTFFKQFYQAQNFSRSTSMFLILLPCNKGISFFKQN